MASTFALAFHKHEHHSSIHELGLLKHAFETLQHIIIFHVCLFYEMNSVQHSSATCVTHSWNMSHTLVTWLVSTMQQTHETYETWLWNKSNISLVLPCFNTCDAWFLCDQCVVWLIILLNNLATLRMSLGTMFMLTILPNYAFK